MPSRSSAPGARSRTASARGATASPPATPPFKWWPYALIAATVAVVYANSLHGVFLFDDLSIVRHPQIRDLGNWRAIVFPPTDSSVAGRPISNLSFLLNYAAGGLDVTGYHLVNIALHVLCAWLVFALTRLTINAFDGFERVRPSATTLSLCAALIWAVHPLNSEVVDYISIRAESLMAACYLGAMYCAARAWRAPRTTPWFVAAVALCVVGALCKETIATAPIAIVLYDHAFAGTTFAEAFRRRGRFYLSLTATWAMNVTALLLPGQMSATPFLTAPTSGWIYLLNQSVLIPHYLRLAIWPRGLVLFYGWSRALTLADVWPWMLGLSVIATASLLLYLRRPRLGFAFVWFFLTLGPTSSILPLPSEVGAERRMYLPLAGLVAWAVITVAQRTTSRRIVGAVVAFVCVGLSAVTIARNREYGSSLGMAETIAARWPSPAADYQLGTELAAAGRHTEAIAHLRAAVDETPLAEYYLGAEFFKTGQFDEAIAHLQQLVARAPDLPIVRSAEVMIARAYALKGDWPQAIAECDRVLATWPADPDAHGLLADALSARQDFGAAIPHYRAFLAAQPSNAIAWTSLGLALIATNDRAGAVEAFAHAADAAPTDVHVRENLARALLDEGRVSEAVTAAMSATTQAPNDPAAHELLGRALAASGHPDDARRELERALALDPHYAPAADALRQLGIRREPAR